MTTLPISKTVARRYALGRQGLWPGRRWAGKDGTAQALHCVESVQMDPLNVIARSHDLALWGRVLDYQSDHLDSLMYGDRAFFDYGSHLRIYPMPELPYWRKDVYNALLPRAYVLITTSCQLCGSLVTRRCEEEGFGVPPG